MQPSMFNVSVPLDGRDDVFLMNTFSDAQLIVSRDVADVLDRIARGERQFAADERDAIDTLVEQGVHRRESGRGSSGAGGVLPQRSGGHASQLRVTVLTTLQCNFACDYCIQGDHGDYNKHAAKMSLDTAARAAEWAEQRLDAVAPVELRADVLRRRAAPQPAGAVLPVRAAARRGCRRAACG